MKTLAALLLCLLPLAVTAQEGTVVYEETVKLDITLPPEMEHMRDRFPTMQTNSKVLLFNEAASLMKAAPKTEEDESAGGDGVRIRFGGRDADDALYNAGVLRQSLAGSRGRRPLGGHAMIHTGPGV